MVAPPCTLSKPLVLVTSITYFSLEYQRFRLDMSWNLWLYIHTETNGETTLRKARK